MGEDGLQEQRANTKLEVERHLARVVLLASVQEAPARSAIDGRPNVTEISLVHGTYRETAEANSEWAKKRGGKEG